MEQTQFYLDSSCGIHYIIHKHGIDGWTSNVGEILYKTITSERIEIRVSVNRRDIANVTIFDKKNNPIFSAKGVFEGNEGSIILCYE